MIQCGSYAGQSSGGSDINVNIGWRPQWVLFKPNTSASWYILDNERGSTKKLYPNTADSEGTTSGVTFTSTGMTITAGSELAYATGYNIVYVAIRAASATTISWPSSVQFTAGSAPQIPALNEVDNYTFSTRDGGTTYTGIQTGNNLS